MVKLIMAKVLYRAAKKRTEKQRQSPDENGIAKVKHCETRRGQSHAEECRAYKAEVVHCTEKQRQSSARRDRATAMLCAETPWQGNERRFYAR